MNPLTYLPRLNQALRLAIAIFYLSGAGGWAGIPVDTAVYNPEIVLELGTDSAKNSTLENNRLVFPGRVSSHDPNSSIEEGKEDISSLHPGFGDWQVGFRFNAVTGLSAKAYRFSARWRQGGEPDVCVQNFEIWAGPDAAKLELRAEFKLKPKGWDYAWLGTGETVTFKPDDSVIEVRNKGAGHDAKIFDAFLLSPALPVQGSADNPLVLLELGDAPILTKTEKGPAVHVQPGAARMGDGAESLVTVADEVQVLHQGFGDWGAVFRFELDPPEQPGRYRFFARYKTGGEVSQVRQQFSVKAGPDPDDLSARGNFILTNDTPWEYQWLEAEDALNLLPGDRWLEIANSGKADGAKVFDAFLLQPEARQADWMNKEQAQIRHRFLALIEPVPNASRHLYVLDGGSEDGDALFRGLADDAARPFYQHLGVTYLSGPPAETTAQRLNLSSLPAAVMTDDHYAILGVLSRPGTEAEAAQFLEDPVRFGTMPLPKPAKQPVPTMLRDGVPNAWLVGGLQDGRAGVSVFGLDNETVLRPNPDQAYLSLQMMGGTLRTWRVAPMQANGLVDIEKSVGHSYRWSHGSAYAQLYLYVERDTQALLHLQQSGADSEGWLDGRAFVFSGHPNPPAELSKIRQGSPKLAQLHLTQGWHSLLVKMVMRHEQGQRFHFAALFTDPSGKPSTTIRTQTVDPLADLALNRIAAKLRPLIFVEAPANLPHPGDTIKLHVDMRWHAVLEEPRLSAPLPRFQAILRLRLVDYDGREIAARTVDGWFPGRAEADFGTLAEAGYYAVYASLHSPDGRLIMNYPADGFSVVRGNAEQRQRLNRKKLWNNNYYALADGDRSFMRPDGFFTWLERMGLFKNVGGYPGFDPQFKSRWKEAERRGLQLFADSSGDSSWLNDNPADGERFIRQAAEFTRFFKSTNEIDIRLEPEWQKIRDPEHWVRRAKREYEWSHRYRSDAHYVGGSLVRPGDENGPGQWFKRVLQLGLDNYQDAWDVHAYPQNSPRFGDPIGNSEAEDERGVLAAYDALGMTNRLPFWLGETGAKSMHGATGRRWQAEQAAKMIAWVNSRSDYLGLAFCIGHEYDLAYGRIWDYSMGHKPGEAALYTAGALIDGLPYKAVDTGNDEDIQAAYFGGTFMIWHAGATAGTWRLRLDAKKSWVIVDVVGHVEDLAVPPSGYTEIAISSSPVYVLTRADLNRLTRF